MNRKEIETRRMDNMKLLDSAYRNCINHFKYDSGNSIEHEMAKFICFVLLRNGVPSTNLQECMDHFRWCEDEKLFDFRISSETTTRLIKQYGQKFKEDWERRCVVVEARFKPIMTRRALWAESKASAVSEKEELPIGKAHAGIVGVDLSKMVDPILRRRVDLFVLDTGEIVEIETDPQRAKRFKDDKNTIVVMI